MNKVDLYHFMYLFMFISFLALPQYKLGITRLLIYYSAFFIILKHIYTLLQISYIIEHYDFLEFMGLASSYERQSTWHIFEYSFKAQQWIVLIAAYFFGKIQEIGFHKQT